MATPFVVSGWCPLGAGPVDDDACFEALAAAVFQARFRPAIVQQRWPAIRAAFAGFSLATVAGWEDAAVDELLRAPGMIRNPKKVRAVLGNARELHRLAQRHGSVQAYFDRCGGPDDLVRELDRWVHYLGAPSLRWYLGCLGRAAEWRAA